MATAPQVFTSHTTKTVRVLYSAPVFACTRRLLVMPPSARSSQRVTECTWHCTPPPLAQRETSDDFGNRVLELRHRRIEREFHFTLALTTTRHDSGAPAFANVPPQGLGAYRLSSALCDLGPAVRTAAARFSLGDDAASLADDLCSFTHAALRYQPGTTHVETTASQVLERGNGVCQDYANVMIATARALGLAARYVSGYNPAEGVMHAWVEVLCGDAWLAWDPTHNRRTQPTCVFVACGRDYRDVTPISGTFRGRARARLQTRCRTTNG